MKKNENPDAAPFITHPAAFHIHLSFRRMQRPSDPPNLTDATTVVRPGTLYYSSVVVVPVVPGVDNQRVRESQHTHVRAAANKPCDKKYRVCQGCRSCPWERARAPAMEWTDSGNSVALNTTSTDICVYESSPRSTTQMEIIGPRSHVSKGAPPERQRKAFPPNHTTGRRGDPRFATTNQGRHFTLRPQTAQHPVPKFLGAGHELT